MPRNRPLGLLAVAVTLGVAGCSPGATKPAADAQATHRTPAAAPSRSPARPAASPPPAAPSAKPKPKPKLLFPLAAPRALPGTRGWVPAGRLIQGHPAVYETTLRPASNPGTLVGVAWLDTRLLRATLYSGSSSPGGFGWAYTAPISPAAAKTLVAAFNGGFKLGDSQGGYYSEGRYAAPLRPGAASFVIYRDGSATVGAWGRDVTMSPAVVAVRQNLPLLVDHGQPVPGLNPGDHSAWGPTLGPSPYVWRSGVGVTASGALVYAAGPALSVVDIAAALAQAGAVRAMELDINPYWPVFATFTPPPGGLAGPGNATPLSPRPVGTALRFFQPSWARDFITMSGRPVPR